MGGHGHGHGHGEPYKIPDYRIYKVADAPELVEIERALAAHGLKDPWLRNEVWRYNTKEFQTFEQRVKITVFRGFRFGFAAFVATIIGTKIYEKMYPDEHDHGHGHGGHGSH